MITERCSFCGRDKRKDVKKIFAGPGVYICDICVRICGDILNKDQLPLGKHLDVSEGLLVPKPREIKAKLDQYVIGQDQAKRAHGEKPCARFFLPTHRKAETHKEPAPSPGASCHPLPGGEGFCSLLPLGEGLGMRGLSLLAGH